MFDLYAFADYSGSLRPAEQRKKIALSMIDAGNRVSQTKTGWTRETLFQEIKRLLMDAADSGKRMIFGFDHNYSFPSGFYEAMTGRTWTRWRDLLVLLAEGTQGIDELDLENPRLWAKEANRVIADRFQLECGGPFWGPHFDPMKKPEFPFGHILKERRLIEEHCPQMKSIFQLGGAGSVGLQSLLGLVHLYRLIEFCKEQQILLHCWPYDGWEVPDSGHVLVEMYPTLHNRGKRTDRNDAEACAIWLAEQDRKGTLAGWFQANLRPEERRLALLEGWLLGYDNIRGGIEAKGGHGDGTIRGRHSHGS